MPPMGLEGPLMSEGFFPTFATNETDLNPLGAAGVLEITHSHFAGSVS